MFRKILFILLFSLMAHRPSARSRSTCGRFRWRCESGECIRNDELCDGVAHCRDASDETTRNCLHRECPSYAFHCAYGACITGKYMCNGIKDCLDGSDESEVLCTGNFTKWSEQIRGNCSEKLSMECKSGDCISNEKVCDGAEDCLDGSDERTELCSFFRCPDYSFRCGYGACVAGNARCNGVRDCADGSDELPLLCGYKAETPFNTTTTTTTTTTTRKPFWDFGSTTQMSTSRRPFLEYPTWVTTPTRKPSTAPSADTTTMQPPDAVESSEKHCAAATLTRGLSTVATCSLSGQKVSCLKAIRAGTQANIACAPGYKMPSPKAEYTSITCEQDGEWNYPKYVCSPECGTLSAQQQVQAIKPWDVTIFRRNFHPEFHPLCSGVIVSPKIVLTAANCFKGITVGFSIEPVLYNIVEGHHKTSYSQGAPIGRTVHNVSEIMLFEAEAAQSDGLAVLVLVNYFSFSASLKPICLPALERPEEVPLSKYDVDSLNIGRGLTSQDTRYQLTSIVSSLQEDEKIGYVHVTHFMADIRRQIDRYKHLL